MKENHRMSFAKRECVCIPCPCESPEPPEVCCACFSYFRDMKGTRNRQKQRRSAIKICKMSAPLLFLGLLGGLGGPSLPRRSSALRLCFWVCWEAWGGPSLPRRFSACLNRKSLATPARLKESPWRGLLNSSKNTEALGLVAPPRPSRRLEGLQTIFGEKPAGSTPLTGPPHGDSRRNPAASRNRCGRPPPASHAGGPLLGVK